ncbi:hypothetical protein HNY73_001090 [Argiope bruennichi]|uniref:C2H2-type domain-containing protein n=1 Tax=Argiope bruennichi TaxID=94029 RepID=A0A8T0G073_ARGBR|nr:hypothetical protein HNY73_001090 [Argiope bruennichi]
MNSLPRRQSLKETEKPSSTKSLRSNITGKLQTLLNGFVSELQNISEDKRQDVALLFNPKYKESNCANDTSGVKSAFPSLSNSQDSTKVLKNFIDSAKSRISGLLSNKQENQGSGGNNLLKNLQPSSQTKTKTLSIDPLEIQINLKFQSLLFKAFDTKKGNHVNKKQAITTSESIISEKDWQDLSRMLQDFSHSAKRKLHASLTKERNTQFQNGSVSIQNSPVKESQPFNNTRSLVIASQRKDQNKELQKPVNLQNPSCSPANNSSKLTKKNAKLLKMDFSSESTDSSNSPRNPYDERYMLLLSDAEKCPNYVYLHLSSDSDERENIAESPNSLMQKSESEDEVIVLGEKSKTYQEVTLEEDDDGQVHESVVEKIAEKCAKKEREVEEPVFNCPICDKSYRAQSLLQFHIKMHTAENPSSKVSQNRYPNSSSSSEDESSSLERPTLNQRNLDICISQGAHVSRKDLGSNDAVYILNEKSSRTSNKSFRKVKESTKCLTNHQIEHYSDDKENSDLDKNRDLNHSSYKTSFRKDKAKSSFSHENFTSRVASSSGKERFLQIERCPDNPDLSIIYDWEIFDSEKSPKKVKEEPSYENKHFEKYKDFKSSADYENLALKNATFSQKDLSSVDKGRFLSNEQIVEYPNYSDLSLVCDWKCSKSVKSPKYLKKDPLYVNKDFGSNDKASKCSASSKNLVSKNAAISKQILNSITEKSLKSKYQIERCPDYPDLSMVYDWESLDSEKNPHTLKKENQFANDKSFETDKDSKSICTCKNCTSENAIIYEETTSFRNEVGFLEGPIEHCPEYPDLSMLYDGKNSSKISNSNIIDESYSSDDEKNSKQNETFNIMK